MMKSLTLCFGLFAVIAAHAAELVINVSGDTDFDAALAALTGYDPQPSRETLNGGAYAAYDIRKTGAGKLVFARNRFLATWTGNLYVDEGTVEVQVNCESATYGTSYYQALGKQTDYTNGGVFVKDGATVMITVDKYEDYSGYSGNGINRAFHLAGTGVGNAGALRLNAGGDAGGCARAACPYRTVLDENATITLCSSLVWENKEVNLNGHALTVKSDSSTVRSFVETMDTVGEGHLVFDGVICCTRSSVTTKWKNPSGQNTVTFRNKGYFSFNNGSTNILAQPWKYIYETTADPYVESVCKGTAQPSTDYACFPGGFVSATDVTLRLTQKNEKDVAPTLANAITFKGKVSGVGGYQFDGVVNNSGPYGSPWVNFLAPDNDFTGPLTILNAGLGLGTGSSLPAGTATKLANATVRVADSEATGLAFGALDASNEVSIVRVNDGGLLPSTFSVSATKLTKVGEGTLTVNADGFAADEVTINGGRVKLAKATTQADFAGLVAGKSHVFSPFDNPFTSTKLLKDYGFAGDGQLKDVCPYILYTNEVQASGPDVFYTPHGEGYQATDWKPKFYCRLMTYSGYIVNTSDAAKTVNLICTLNAYTRIKIGANEYVSSDPVRNQPEALPSHGSPVAPRMNRQITIPSGISRFEIRTYDRYGQKPEKYADNDPNYPGQEKPFCYGNVCTNGLENWDDRHGLMWSEKTTSKKLADYHPFADDGNGLVFLTTEKVSGAWTAGAISGTGVLDLDGETLAARSVSGTLRVINGTLNVTNGLSFEPGVHSLLGSVMNRAAAAGLMYGHIAPHESNAAASKHFNDHEIVRESVKTSLDYFYTDQAHIAATFGKYAYVSYDGYLWNNTDTDQTWSIATTHDGFTRIAVNGVEFTSNYKWYTEWPNKGANGEWKEGCSTLWTDITLKPGANRFTVYAAAQYAGAPYIGNVAFGAGTNWVDGLGLAYDPQNRKVFDRQHFSKFEDPGDGSFMTFCEISDAIGCSYEKLSGVKGTVLDMNCGEAFVKDFAGVAVVSNGLLHLTGALTMTAAEINDADACLDGVKFIDGATFDVADAAADVKLSSKGRVVARHVAGDVCPTLGPNLAEAGWTIALKDGEVRIFNAPGLMLIVR